jgi:hypothetical protein
MYGKASVNLRISALLLAALLAGCGFTDATNQTGSTFLANQGISISARDSFRTTVPVLGVQVVPVEGIPSPNGLEALWLGGTLNDSIRAVVAFDLTNTSAPDAGFKAIQAVDSLASKYKLTRLSFGIGSGGDTDTSTPRQIHVRFLLVDSTPQTTWTLPALFMGVEPSALGLTPIVDRDSTFVPSVNLGIPFGPALRDSVAARLKAAKPTWLVAILDGHPGWQSVFSVGDPRLRTDSVSGSAEGSFLPGEFQARTAWRSTEMRSSNAWNRSLGWWVGGGNRLRVTLDGNALRTLLHQRLGKGIVSDSFDNSFNVLQARVRVPFSGFHWVQGASADNRSMGIDGAVVLDTGSSALATVSAMPISIKAYLTELGLTVVPYLQFDDSFPSILQGRFYLENNLSDVPTRLSLGMGSTSSYTSTNFWLRKDVPDSMEFRISSQVRVRVSHYPNDANVHIHWSLLQGSPIADPQIGIGDTARPETRVSDTALANTTSPVVHQEARTSFSLAVIQEKFHVDLDLVPAGGTIGMQDLWEAAPSATNIVDSLGLIVRPRDGSEF